MGFLRVTNVFLQGGGAIYVGVQPFQGATTGQCSATEASGRLAAVTLDSVSLEGNQAWDRGGGVHVAAGSLSMNVSVEFDYCWGSACQFECCRLMTTFLEQLCSAKLVCLQAFRPTRLACLPASPVFGNSCRRPYCPILQTVELLGNAAVGGGMYQGMGGGIALEERCATAGGPCRPVSASLAALNASGNAAALAGGGLYFAGAHPDSSLAVRCGAAGACGGFSAVPLQQHGEA
jgi:hypothetical protein